jgi:WD40 repeat protein
MKVGGVYGTALQAASGGGHDKTLELLLGKGADVNALHGLQAYAAAWHFSPLKSIVRSTFQDQALQGIRVIREIPEQWNACLLAFEGHSNSVISVVFSPNGTLVASGSIDNTVRVWDVQTGKCEHTLESHSNSVQSVVSSADGTRVASGSRDKTVRVWDMQTGECQALSRPEHHCDTSPTSDIL